MIKAIIFDFGNVLCRFTNEILMEKIGALSGKTKEEIFDLVYKNSDITKRFETGLISSKEFFEELSKICGIAIDYEELRRIYSEDKFTPVEGMEELIKSLRGKYKIGLLSNTSEWDWNYMIKAAPMIESFDTITTSYGVKAMKPSPKIFEDALKKLNLKPEECVYADDIEEYVLVAQGLGIKAFQFTEVEKFKRDLESVGVEI